MPAVQISMHKALFLELLHLWGFVIVDPAAVKEETQGGNRNPHLEKLSIVCWLLVDAVLAKTKSCIEDLRSKRDLSRNVRIKWGAEKHTSSPEIYHIWGKWNLLCWMRTLWGPFQQFSPHDNQVLNWGPFCKHCWCDCRKLLHNIQQWQTVQHCWPKVPFCDLWATSPSHCSFTSVSPSV